MLPASTNAALCDVYEERSLQENKWGEQNHPDLSPDSDFGALNQDYANQADAYKYLNDERVKGGTLAWDGILLEEVFEALAESAADKLRAELVQVAAVAVAWIEAIDRRVVETEAALAASPWPGTEEPV